MADKVEKVRRSADSSPPASAEEFAQSLRRRSKAAKGLEQDLLTAVPMLYGSPTLGDVLPKDPGIVLAHVHRDELVRRNGGGVFHRDVKRSDVALPFERMMIAASILMFLFALFS
ncbi:MAG: hypothetical protein H0W74_03795 [Sphingosinicella sp.]|nr:hypothetical protein [Sphingosinicella sp.]